MKRISPSLFLFALAAVLFTAAVPPPRPGKDFALFFAINDYQRDGTYPDLKFPIENARRIAAELKKNYAFDTLVVTNPTRQQIKDRLEAYKKDFAAGRKDREGQLLVFFTGHGVQQYGNGYFLPANADPADLDGSALQYGSWRNFINEIDCKHILVALDACHSGTFDPEFGRKPGGLFGTRAGELSEGDKLRQQHTNTRARLYFASGAPDQTTPDKSAFAKKFLEGLLTKGYGDGLLTSSELYVSLESAAPRPLRGEFGSDEAGSSFLFFYNGPTDLPDADPAAVAERAAWNEAKKANTLQAYRDFLRQHPHGDFAELARDRIAALDDAAAWTEAKRLNTQEAYREFIKKFPDSEYAEIAKKRLAPTPDPGNLIKTNGENAAQPALAGFALVQGGTFQMGDSFGDKEAGNDEKPLHSVTVGSFYMSKTELTFDEFDAFCASTGRDKPSDQGWGRGRRPAINVDWYDAVEYCNWRSQKEGLTPAYTINKNAQDPDNSNSSDTKKWTVACQWAANGYRLPTEAEWEYAAREGGKKIRFGNGKDTADPSEINFDASKDYKKSYSVVATYRQKTVPVDELSANALGLRHMSGNVYEWCWDWYDSGYYAQSGGASDPKGQSKGQFRVVRGGCWDYSPEYCRSAYRYVRFPNNRDFWCGFRVVRHL